jgi:Ca-activated chloride channel family protein
MCRLHSPRSPIRVFVLALLVAAIGSPASAQPKALAVTSPTKVLKAITYGGPMTLESIPTRQEGPDHSLAPYLYVAGGDPEKDQVPLKKTWAEIDVAGVIAAVKVHQVFENTGGKPIEAIYVFPASTRAAVHAMRMRIGARTIEARIERKAEARAQYDAAKQAGKRASLLEQQRANVFTTSVANIMPGDRIEVELDYSELLVPDHGTYELVYPTVVGPRYTGGANPQSDQWMANPHLSEGKAEPYAWDVKVHLQTGIGLKEVSSPSHKIRVSYAGPSTADVTLDQEGGGNKDFVLRYRLAGNKIETGLLQFEEPTAGLSRANERFFALLVEPPARPALADIPSREYIFVLDVSGSMHGFPLDTAKELMRNLLPKLRPTDRFNLVFFSGANYVWSPSGSKPATEANIREGMDKILRESGGGGTELMGGLQAAYGIPRGGQGVSRTVVVVTDGYVGVEAQAFRFIREHLDQANLFAFGIGSSVNRALIEGMARAGLGEPFVVLGPQKASAEADKLRTMIDRPLLTDIQLHVDGAGVYDVAPEKIPDLLAERPLLIYGKYRGHGPTRIEITGRTGRGVFRHAVDLRPADARKENAALRALWARKWVEILEDEHHMGGGKPVEEAITNLGLFYSLLTPFTSFVAIDSEVVNRTGKLDTIRQPLPMPEGVSNLAVAEKKSMMAVAPSPVAAQAPAGYARAAGRRSKDLDDLSILGKIGMGAHSSGRPMLAMPAEEATEAEAPKQAPVRAKRPACHATVAVDKSRGASNTRGLEALVARTARALGCAWTGEIKLRLAIDQAGKIVAVTVVSGDADAGRALAGKLTSSSSATRATGKDTAVIELTVRNGTG